MGINDAQFNCWYGIVSPVNHSLEMKNSFNLIELESENVELL